MKHRIFALILAAMMLLTALPVSADEVTEPTNVPREPGYCGDAMVWEFAEGVLTVTGAGKMDDFPEGAPWEAHKKEIETVLISDGITYIGANAFRDYDALTAVQFGDAVYEIGEYAFFSCDGLTVVHLPASFKVFGPSSFMGCTKLTEFHCAGKFPSFRQNCLWDTYAKIYFPAERPWSVDLIRDLEDAFHGRIEFLASDGSDPYEPMEAPAETTVPTEAPTEEPTTEPTEPPTTAPPATQAPTEMVTEPAPVQTEPPTEAPTAPNLIAPAPTEPVEEEPEGSNFGLIIIAAVAVLLVLGSIIFGGGRKKGKYAR